MATTPPATRVKEYEKVREYYVERKGLFGFLTWEEITRTERAGKELHVFTEPTLKEVFVNGVQISLSPTEN